MDTEDFAADAALFARLREVWEELDPVPADFVDRMVAAVAVEDLSREYALLTLVEESALAAVRGESDTATMQFSDGDDERARARDRHRSRRASRRRMGGCRDPRHPSCPRRPRLVGRRGRARTLRVRLGARRAHAAAPRRARRRRRAARLPDPAIRGVNRSDAAARGLGILPVNERHDRWPTSHDLARQGERRTPASPGRVPRPEARARARAAGVHHGVRAGTPADLRRHRRMLENLLRRGRRELGWDIEHRNHPRRIELGGELSERASSRRPSRTRRRAGAARRRLAPAAAARRKALLTAAVASGAASRSRAGRQEARGYGVRRRTAARRSRSPAEIAAALPARRPQLADRRRRLASGGGRPIRGRGRFPRAPRRRAGSRLSVDPIGINPHAQTNPHARRTRTRRTRTPDEPLRGRRLRVSREWRAGGRVATSAPTPARSPPAPSRSADARRRHRRHRLRSPSTLAARRDGAVDDLVRRRPPSPAVPARVIGIEDPSTDPEVYGDQAGPRDGFLDDASGHGTFVAGIVRQLAPTPTSSRPRRRQQRHRARERADRRRRGARGLGGERHAPMTPTTSTC